MTPNTPDPVKLLRQMILVREFEELAIKLRIAGKIYGHLHPYVGQEAIAVGVCANLTPADRVTSTHRGHGHCVAKGADIGRMMAELFGRVDGYCKGKGGSMHIADFAVGMLGANGIVAGGIPTAAGAALAAKLDGKGDVAVAFFGDGAVTEGEFHETMNISSVWKLPIIFVCENNQYASNNAVEVQHRIVDVAVHAAAYDMPGQTVDGNDVLAVFEAARTAVKRARSGEGPSLLECKTYRRYFHVMRDRPPPELRPEAEIAAWVERDPITRLAAELTNRGVLGEIEVARMRKEVEDELARAVDFAEQSPFPDPKDLYADVFAR